MQINPFRSGKHLVYTVISGDYDSLKKPLWRPTNVDYLAFVSSPSSRTALGWQLLPLPNSDRTPKLVNREMKMLAGKFARRYDSVIYIDGSIQIIGSLEPVISCFLASGRSLGLFKHNERKTPWEELAACKEMGYLSQDEYRFEERRLQPFRSKSIALGLYDAGVVLKNQNHESFLEIVGRWFELFMQNPARDQLSLPIVAWEYSQEILQFDHWRKTSAPLFLRYPHRTSGRGLRFLFLLGSAHPRLFQRAILYAERRRKRVASSKRSC